MDEKVVIENREAELCEENKNKIETRDLVKSENLEEQDEIEMLRGGILRNEQR